MPTMTAKIADWYSDREWLHFILYFILFCVIVPLTFDVLLRALAVVLTGVLWIVSEVFFFSGGGVGDIML